MIELMLLMCGIGCPQGVSLLYNRFLGAVVGLHGCHLRLPIGFDIE